MTTLSRLASMAGSWAGSATTAGGRFSRALGRWIQQFFRPLLLRCRDLKRTHDMSPFNLDERKRRSRNIVLFAFLALVVIWGVKLSRPQSTVLSAWGAYSASSGEVSQPQQMKGADGEWHSVSPSLMNANGTDSSKAAVIVETRFRMNLIPLILHFASVLGPSWPIIIYTSVEAINSFATSAALKRYIKTGSVTLRLLPQETFFTNSDSVNKFMTETWLWESLDPAEHVLLFQSDSMLCGNAARSVDDYLHYDLVGAPIRKGLGVGYNGGLSLRKRSTTLKVLERWSWEETQSKGDRFEDQWYYNRMKELEEEDESEGRKAGDMGAINLPSVEIARTFSVETIDYPHPLGVHQVHRWLKDQILSLDEWCPEYKLCSVDHVADEPDTTGA